MTGHVPAVVAGLCDDAAVFPPGLAPLPDAIAAYRKRRLRWYHELVGPLVLAADALPQLGSLLPPAARVPLSVTLPAGPAELPAVLARTRALPAELRSVEIAVPQGVAAGEFLDELAATLPEAGDFDVYVELPRGDQRMVILDALRGRCLAKLRTGGVRADLYPDEAELAAAVAAVVEAGVPFKATAGLHHAVRNTDPDTGFEQHGFLNLLLAADALVRGGTERDARALLAERDGATVAGLVRDLDPGPARTTFRSFGTCSITDPRDELVKLGLLTVPVATRIPEGASS